jgi:hypothetical protein
MMKKCQLCPKQFEVHLIDERNPDGKLSLVYMLHHGGGRYEAVGVRDGNKDKCSKCHEKEKEHA